MVASTTRRNPRATTLEQPQATPKSGRREALHGDEHRAA